ncbi:MAG TPA: hypothetical protein VJW20_17545 [Candidatus Angelobacter sp.]|nr:hypothetical protein [Candidatus Angelobacter sp.]
MKLIGLYDASASEMNRTAGLFVASCGYEERSSASLKILKGSIKDRFVFSFSENQDALHRQDNDKKFDSAQFQSIKASGGDARLVRHSISRMLTNPALSALAVDISSMTRPWHGAIVSALRNSHRKTSIEVYFVYVPAVYRKPPEQISPLEQVGPVEGFASFAPPTLPVALVLGLGYERERAIGLQELLDPRMTSLMIPHSGPDDKFFASVTSSNSEILSRTGPQWIFEYPLNSPLGSFRLLESLCLGLERKYRVVLASLGPKLFGVICLLLSTVHPQLSVWRITSGAMGSPRDVTGDLANVVVCRTVWEPETTPS